MLSILFFLFVFSLLFFNIPSLFLHFLNIPFQNPKWLLCLLTIVSLVWVCALLFLPFTTPFLDIPFPETQFAINFVCSCCCFQGAAQGGRQNEFDHFFCFRDSFGPFLVTFLMLLSSFFSPFLLSNSFCRTPFTSR